MLLLQVDSTGVTNTTSISLLELILKGGMTSNIVLFCIALLFVIAIYIFLERIFTLQKAAKSPEAMMERVRTQVLDGDIEGAKNTCKKVNNPTARMISKGLTRLGTPLKNIETSIEYIGKIEVYRLEKNLSFLGTISGAAPMIGFLGTVIGMIQAFLQIERMGGGVDPSALAGGIYTALITTVAGLIVGILANIAYNYLITRVQKVIHNMEYTAMDFMDLLQEPR